MDEEEYTCRECIHYCPSDKEDWGICMVMTFVESSYVQAGTIQWYEGDDKACPYLERR